KSKNEIQAIRDDGKLMIVSSTQRNGRDTDLFVVDPRQPGFQRTLMEVKNEHWIATDWSHDGKSLLLNRYVSINECYPAVIDFESGQRRDLPLPGNEKAAVGALEFAADSKTAYIASDAENEFRRLAQLDLVSGKYEWLTGDIRWDVNGLKVHDESSKVAFTVNADGATQLFLLEPQNGKLNRRELPLPTGILTSLEFSPDGKNLGFTLARPDAPSDAY